MWTAVHGAVVAERPAGPVRPDEGVERVVDGTLWVSGRVVPRPGHLIAIVYLYYDISIDVGNDANLKSTGRAGKWMCFEGRAGSVKEGTHKSV